MRTIIFTSRMVISIIPGTRIHQEVNTAISTKFQTFCESTITQQHLRWYPNCYARMRNELVISESINDHNKSKNLIRFDLSALLVYNEILLFDKLPLREPSNVQICKFVRFHSSIKYILKSSKLIS